MNRCPKYAFALLLFCFCQVCWSQDKVNLAVEQERSGQVRFSWSDPRFRLEQTAALSTNATWNPVLVQPRIEAGATVTLSTDRQHQFFRLRFVPVVGSPADPRTVASPIVSGVTTAFTASTAFLYTGANPIQTGVTNGTIAPIRAAVLRGRVVTMANSPLEGVTISILDHPEFGRTLSRADGAFDVVVNGGGVRTVVYEKSGFLSAQRQMDTKWQEYVLVPEVALVPLDPVATPVAFGPTAPMQVARSSVQTDAAGTRSSTLIFPPATAVSLMLPNGSTQQLASLSIRATEYTVGENGPKAMPALLPPTSAYTYCVELSADEAIAAGASEIRFDRPVFHYVENFLGFPVGTVVPTGYYDRKKAVWVASENGVVMKLLAMNGGIADLDLNGDGAVDAEALLTQHGVTTAERQQLATLYPAGQTLWRVPIKHFTPIDENWPVWPPADAREPDQPPPVDQQTMDQCFDEATGSIIECQNQILGESIPITGTPFTLNYRSNRTPGWLPSNILPISLSGPTVPPSLKRIELTIEVAGRKFDQIFPPQPNQQIVFVWDGIDAYDRQLSGQQKVSGSIRYIYEAVFAAPDPAEAAFARPGRGPLNVRSRGEFALSQPIETKLGRFDARPHGLGGWTLSSHHSYDVVGQSVYLGTGRRQSASSLESVIGTIAGTGAVVFNGDGIAATAANFGPTGMAVAPDGSVYISDFSNKRIRRVGPGGIISTIAGTGQLGFNGDGIPALQANIDSPLNLALGPDGSVYFADNVQRRIRRIGPDGIITTVAGTGNFNYNGDGIPAVEANLSNPIDVALAADGSLYIADSRHERVRRVDPSGIISTFAGNSAFGGSSPDGVPATNVDLEPSRLAVGPDGAVYIAADFKVRRVGPDGVISTVAGTGARGDFNGDGIPAVNAIIAPSSLAISSDGSLYFGDIFRIRRIDPDGIITTVAGTGFAGEFQGNGLPALATHVFPWTIGFAPDGTLYFSDAGNSRIRRIRSHLPGLTVGDFTLASDDGYHLYEFSDDGRHQRTLHTITGAVLYEFNYDSDGRLARVIEKTGGTDNTTTIEHDAAGHPSAIVSTFGQRTALFVDHSGYLTQVVNPAGDSIQLTSSTNGLLQAYTDPRGNRSEYTFDPEGRLVRADAPGDGFQTFTRTSSSNSFTVVRSTALNRTNIYHVEELADGTVRSVTTLPDGSSKEATRSPAGGGTVTQADGTIMSTVLIPDPRFGMQAPLVSSFKVAFPSSLTYSVSNRLAVFISNRFNILSVTNQTARTTIAGQTTTNIYRAATRSFTHTTPGGRSHITTIDALGRWTQSQFGNLAPLSLTYDTRGRVATMSVGSGGSARSLTFEYDAQSFLQTITDPIGRIARFAYDPAGRLLSKTLPDGRVLTFTYDRAGNPTTVTPPGRPAYTLGYSGLNEFTEFDPPTVPGSARTTISYDAEGAVTNIARAGGQAISIDFDAVGRATTRRLIATETPTLSDSFSYDPAGRLTNVTSASAVALQFVYDGALPSITKWSGPVQGEVSRTYDQALRLAAQTVNGGSRVVLSYDADGLLKSAGTLTLVRNRQNGLATQSTLDSVTANRAFNNFGEMTNYTINAAVGSLYDAHYVRDALGRITQKRETVQNTTDTFLFAYDVIGQLTNVTRNGSVAESYTYDANGNRVQAMLDGASLTATYDAQDRLGQLGSATYSYNGSGDLLSKSDATGTTRFDYDPLGNLRAVTLADDTSVAYLIDGLNRRVGRKVNGVHLQSWLYDDLLRPAAELDANGVIVSRFVYSGGTVPAYLLKGDVAFRIVTDQVGSVRLVINATSGAVAQRLDYDSFGRVLIDSSPGFQPFGFAGGLYDPATRLVHFGTRDYDAETGRWTTQDKLFFAGNDANLYRYCHNDPVNFLDPTGLDNWDAAQGFLDQLNEEIQITANPMLGLNLLLDSLIKAGARTLGFDPGPTMREVMFHSSFTTADRNSEDYATGELAGVCVGVVGQLATGGILQKGFAAASLHAERLARQGRIAERFATSQGRKIPFSDLQAAAADFRNNGRRFEQAVQEEVVELMKGWKTGNGGSGIGGGGGW